MFFRWGPTGQLDTICNVKTQVIGEQMYKITIFDKKHVIFLTLLNASSKKIAKMIVIMMIRMQEFEHVILESALENVVNKFRRHITIKVEKTELVFIIREISFHIP